MSRKIISFVIHSCKRLKVPAAFQTNLHLGLREILNKVEDYRPNEATWYGFSLHHCLLELPARNEFHARMPFLKALPIAGSSPFPARVVGQCIARLQLSHCTG